MSEDYVKTKEWNELIIQLKFMLISNLPSRSCSIVAVASILRQLVSVPCRAASIKIIRAVFRQLTFSSVRVSTEMDETNRAR